MNTKQVTFAAGAAVATLGLQFGTRPPDADYQRYVFAKLASGTWTPATLSVKISSDGTNYYPLYVTSAYPGVAGIVTTEWRGFAIPAGFDFIKFWSQDGSGNDTNQSAGNVLDVLY